MLRRKNKNMNGLLPASVVEAAADGDMDAINAVLNHFDRYIAVLSAKLIYDWRRILRLTVDEKLRRRSETKLITSILTFKVA